MKKALVVFSAVLAVSLVSLAQQDAAGTATTSVTGCLARSAQAYTLTDQTGAEAAAPAPPEPANAPAQSDATAPPPQEAARLQTASPLPLIGILAVGFLCAGYMTLRTN
jgi:hypothetical protein